MAFFKAAPLAFGRHLGGAAQRAIARRRRRADRPHFLEEIDHVGDLLGTARTAEDVPPSAAMARCAARRDVGRMRAGAA